MKIRRVIGVSMALAGGVGLGARLSDGSTIEGPPSKSEVFYLSVNHYTDGEKSDDRLGDAALLLAFGGLLTAIVPAEVLRRRYESEATA